MTTPASGSEPDAPTDPPAAAPAGARPGSTIFTIEGRPAPALYIVGWLATPLGLGLVALAILSGGGLAFGVGFILGMVTLSVGLIAASGAQAIERRARGTVSYAGPSPFLVLAASIPISLLAATVIALPLLALGVPIDGPLASLLSIAAEAVVYVSLIRMLVVDTGALDWHAMGIRRLDLRALGDIGGGALWAIPVIFLTIPVAQILLAIFPVKPESPLPPTGEPVGFALSLLAAAIVAPLGEEILFRGFAATAWVRGMGIRGGVVRAALVFAFAHVLTISATSTGDAVGLAAVGFGTRVPIGLALGVLFVRRGTIWSSFGLHAAFNAILLVAAELAPHAI